jgi:hypothetical protein
MCIQFRLAQNSAKPDQPERNDCASRGVSVVCLFVRSLMLQLAHARA